MTTGSTERRQFVTFEVAGELFAADIFAVERVLRYTAPRMLPNAAPWLRGVIAHGGAAIPLIMKALKIDPAVTAGPFITTAADIVTVLIYFNVAAAMLE